MDQIALIIAALSNGARSGLQQSASSAVKSTYDSLRALAEKRLSSSKDGALVLSHHENAPEIWQSALASELRKAGAGRDADLLATAAALIRLIDEAGYGTGLQRSKSTGIFLGNSSGVVVTNNLIRNLDIGIHAPNVKDLQINDNDILG